MNDFVKIKLVEEDTQHAMALFASTGVPKEIDFTLDSSKKHEIQGLDVISGLKFNGFADKTSDYYIGIRDKDILEIHPLLMYKMKPQIELNETIISRELGLTPLTKKEQIEEMKEKFGSRKTQRSLASKRKYAIEFGEEDVEQIETKRRSLEESTAVQLANESTINDSLDILPLQNREAICVEEVYDLNEIITEYERNILTQYQSELFQQIDNSFVKQLISNPNDSEQKLIGIYINLMITLLNLKSNDLRAADPLPKLTTEVKQFLLNRYLTTQNTGGKTKYLLSAKQKDRLLIYGIILSFIVYNYRPIELELIQTTFKVPLRQLRKLVEIIGAYIENFKTSNGLNAKSVVLRVPLNTLTEKKIYSKRR